MRTHFFRTIPEKDKNDSLTGFSSFNIDRGAKVSQT